VPDTSGKTEHHKTSAESVLFPEISDEDLMQDFLRTQEEEHQRNPLSYRIALAFRKAASDLTKLAGYEAALDRKLDRALSKFQCLQDARKAQAAEAAEVSDVTGLNKKES